MAKKKLLVLGGTRISCEIIHKAHAMGHSVIVADYNPVEKSPGKQIADAHFLVSVTDVDAVVKLIHDEKVDGVMLGFADVILPYYAEICRKANLPAYGTKGQFDLFINKDKYKALMRKFGVPTVEEYDVNSEDFSADTVRFPVLVKPADSSGARGITVCDTKESLKQAVAKARRFSQSGKVLVERYLTGKEVTVFWVFQDGEYYLSAIGNRHVKQNQGSDVIPLPVGYTFPASVIPRYRAEVEPKVKEMLRYAGIRNGMMFMQCKVEDGSCIVYDIGFRLTGSLEYKVLKQVCGYDPLEMMINFALTGSMGEPDLARKADPMFAQPAYNVSCLCAPGTIAHINGIDEVTRVDGVIDVVLAHIEGETVTQEMRGLLSQIVVRVLGVVKKKEDLYAIMHEIEEKVSVISTTGDDMMLSGIEESDIEEYVI